MVPAYKVLLFGSFGASMYMMGRLVLVRILSNSERTWALTVCRGTRRGLARTRKTESIGSRVTEGSMGGGFIDLIVQTDNKTCIS